MHLFYLPDLSAETVLLSEDESKHAVRVLRLQSGDAVQLTDGRGAWCAAEVAEDHPKRCLLRIVSRELRPRPRNYRLHLAVAPTKSIDRMEWLLEKATETGLDEFSLLDCAHSERSTVKTARLESIALSAMKQSQQAWLPQINAMMDLPFFLASQKEFPGQKFIAHCREGEKTPLKKIYSPGTPVLLLIGPEGDFSAEEVQLAIQEGFVPVSLGETRLRTETAALLACMGIAWENQV